LVVDLAARSEGVGEGLGQNGEGVCLAWFLE
jgi:hypothetical protein